MGENQILFIFVNSTLNMAPSTRKRLLQECLTLSELMSSMYRMEVNRSLLNSSSYSTFVSKRSQCMDKSGINMSIS